MATGIGSLPHRDVLEACRLMLCAFPDAPVWPQLPRRSFLENFYAQYSEGLAGIRIDSEAERIWFDKGALDEELEAFYQAVIDRDLAYFAMTEEHAAGLAEFLGPLAGELQRATIVKGQVTGPVSFGLTVTDQDGRASLYDETLEQVIVKGLGLKAAWQVDALRKAAPGKPVMMFLDEPYLVSVGSALVSVPRERVMRDMEECLQLIDADVTAMHCCGNTDWSIVFSSGVDIVSFDASSEMEGFIAYHADIGGHLASGGSIAWGIVPNDERVLTTNAGSLAREIESALDALEKRGVNRELLMRRSMITPCCGLGNATVEIAEKALAMTGEVSRLLEGR
jgi:hypothetical protein